MPSPFVAITASPSYLFVVIFSTIKLKSSILFESSFRNFDQFFTIGVFSFTDNRNPLSRRSRVSPFKLTGKSV